MDHYTALKPLSTCVNGARAVSELLATNEDGSENFTVSTLLSEEAAPITRQTLIGRIGDLLTNPSDTELLFYFSGHGRVTDLGPELVTEEVSGESSGVSMDQIAASANRRELRSLTIILDCCVSGSIGELVPLTAGSLAVVQLSKGSALLAAATETGSAFEGTAHSWYTTALLQGLRGAAADLWGRVTPIGLHTLAEAALAGTKQHPVLKVYSDASTILRTCASEVTRKQLRTLRAVFGDGDDALFVPRPLEAVLEGPTSADDEALAIQTLVRLGLIAARRESSTTTNVLLYLTRRGLHYWRLALDDVFDDT